MAKSDWNYQGLAAESYDLWFGSEPFWDQQFFYQRIAENKGHALEIACGTGRLLIPFLRDGLQVEGVDSSAEMLAICRRKARALGIEPVLYHQLMQALNLGRRYRTLFIPACSFQILAEREEAFDALHRFREHLEPGGELLISLFVPWRDFALEGQWRLRRSGKRSSDGAIILIHECTRSDRLEQRQRQWLRLEVFKDGELISSQMRRHSLRWYYKHEFVLMLERVGFRDVSVRCGYGPASGSDPEAELIVSGRV